MEKFFIKKMHKFVQKRKIIKKYNKPKKMNEKTNIKENEKREKLCKDVQSNKKKEEKTFQNATIFILEIAF